MATSSLSRLELTPADLAHVYERRYGNPRTTGPVPRIWNRIGYYVPDVFYEGIVTKTVHANTAWLDVGCGRGIFPSNQGLAKILAQRCRLLVGIDPDDTLEQNVLVHQRTKSRIEAFRSDVQFDLVTLRMVAEHIDRPHEAIASLARLTAPGGKVVLHTINRWSPVALAAWLTPFKIHHVVKHAVWGTEEEDTFPVAYRMNTRKCLRQLFEAHGFKESYFAYHPDCCIFYRFRWLHGLELLLWSILKTLGLTYPENCLLAVYERV